MRHRICMTIVGVLFAVGTLVLSTSKLEAQNACMSTGTVVGGGLGMMNVQKNVHITLTMGTAYALACNVVMQMGVAFCGNRGTWIGAGMNSGNLAALSAQGSGNPTGTCQVRCGECAGGCMSANAVVTNTYCIVTADMSDGLPVELMDFSVR